MKIALLWYDSDPRRTLKEKVLQAAAAYEEKHGKKPNTCIIHPTDGQGGDIDGISVRTAPNILRYHLWIGRSGTTHDSQVAQRDKVQGDSRQV